MRERAELFPELPRFSQPAPARSRRRRDHVARRRRRGAAIALAALHAGQVHTGEQQRQLGGVEFEARIRWNNPPKGLVAAFFTYVSQNALSDELDIEILSKQVAASTGGAPVLFTAWNPNRASKSSPSRKASWGECSPFSPNA